MFTDLDCHEEAIKITGNVCANLEPGLRSFLDMAIKQDLTIYDLIN